MRELDELKMALGLGRARVNEYVLFGSAVLALHGILGRPLGDIDVFVSRRLWGAWLADPAWKVETPRAGDPPFLNLSFETSWRPPIHAFYDWTKRDESWMNVRECFERAEPIIYGGSTIPLQCIPLDLLRTHKALAHSHEPGSVKWLKHQADLRVLDAHLAEACPYCQAWPPVQCALHRPSVEAGFDREQKLDAP